MWAHFLTYRYQRLPRAADDNGLDIPTALIAITTFALLFKVKRVPAPFVILGSGVIGFMVHSYYT
jgi:hypothetical protein